MLRLQPSQVERFVARLSKRHWDDNSPTPPPTTTTKTKAAVAAIVTLVEDSIKGNNDVA